MLTEYREKLQKWLKNPQNREWVFLGILTIVLIFAAARSFRTEVVKELRMVMCFKCRHVECRAVIPEKIEEYKCPKDDGKIGFAWKCRKCQFEFSLIPPKLQEKLSRIERVKYFARYCRCPNCGDENTVPMPLTQARK